MTGAKQEWLSKCADASRYSVDEVERLVVPGTAAYVALEDTRQLAAARAIQAVAASLCADGPGLRQSSTLSYWEDVNLPAFDGAQPIPQGLSHIPPAAGRLLADLAAEPSLRYRGFLALLGLRIAELQPTAQPTGNGTRALTDRVLARIGLRKAERRAPTPRKTRIHVLFDLQSQGGSGVLSLWLLDNGPAGLHPDPATMAFLTVDTEFEQAVRTAWCASALAVTDACVLWSVLDGEEPRNSMQGGSLGAAFAVVLHELHRRRRFLRRFDPRQLDPHTALTGCLASDARTLVKVGGEFQKLDAAMGIKRLRRVVVPEASHDDFKARYDDVKARSEQKDKKSFTLESAVSVRDAIRLTKRSNRRVVFTEAAITMLLVATLFLGFVTYRQQAQAREAAEETSRNTAVSRLLTEADQRRESDPRAALRLALAADAIASSDATEASLLHTLASHPRLGPVFTNHQRAVVAAAVSADGRIMATADEADSTDNRSTIVLWDLTAGPEPRAASSIALDNMNNSQVAYALALSPDGSLLSTGTGPSSVYLWDVSDLDAPRRLDQPEPGFPSFVDAVAFSADGRRLAASGSTTFVEIWDVTDPEAPQPFGGPFRPDIHLTHALAFSPDGQALAAGSRSRRTDNAGEGNVYLVDLTDPAAPRWTAQASPRHTSNINTVAYAPDGRTVASAGDDGTVVLWDVSSGALLPLDPPIETGQVAVEDVAFSPDGHALASAGSDGTAKLWDVTDLAAPMPLGTPLMGHQGPVTEVEFLPDGRTLVSAGDDGTVAYWDVQNLRAPRAGPPVDGLSVAANAAVSADGRLLATDDEENRSAFHLWDISDAREPVHLAGPVIGHTGPVDELALSPDGRVLVSSSAGAERQALTWDVSDARRPEQIGLLPRPTGLFAQLAFVGDGSELRAILNDGLTSTLLSWDVTNPADPQLTETTTVPSGTDMASDAGGTLLAVPGETPNAAVELWRTGLESAATRIGTIPRTGPLADGEDVSFSVSPDGATAAIGYGTRSADLSGSGVLQLWDIRDASSPRQLGETFGNYAGHFGPMTFTPDSKTLVVTATRHSPDPQTSFAHWSGVLDVWDVVDPTKPNRLGRPVEDIPHPVLDITVSEDGRKLVTAVEGFDTSGSVIQWDLGPLADFRANPTGAACRVVGRPLTGDEWDIHASGQEYREVCVATDEPTPHVATTLDLDPNVTPTPTPTPTESPATVPDGCQTVDDLEGEISALYSSQGRGTSTLTSVTIIDRSCTDGWDAVRVMQASDDGGDPSESFYTFRLEVGAWAAYEANGQPATIAAMNEPTCSVAPPAVREVLAC